MGSKVKTTSGRDKQPENRTDRASASFLFIGPMFAVQAYLTAVLIAFIWGPWPWPVVNAYKLYGFLILAQGMLLFGYLSSGRKRPCHDCWRLSWKHLLYISLVLNGLWLYNNLVERTGHEYSSYTEIVASVRSGFVEPGVVYKASHEAMRERGGASLGYLLTLAVSPLLSFMFPLTVLYWNLLGFGAKCLVAVLMLLDALTWVASGANKGLADIVILLPFLLFARTAMVKRKVPWRKILVAVVAFACLGIGFFVSFERGQIGRANNVVHNLYDDSAGIEADQNNVMLRHLAPNERYGVAALLIYITQGYYGLSLCMELPYVPTYGLGNAYYTASWAGKFLALRDVSNNTYPGRANEAFGWDDFARWDSIYPWLASDLTFPGTILAMALIGRLFALAWRDMVWGGHPVAAIVCCHLIILCIYIPANNQVLGFPRSGASFIVTLLWWLMSRRRLI
jgi:hypothetical protein